MGKTVSCPSFETDEQQCGKALVVGSMQVLDCILALGKQPGMCTTFDEFNGKMKKVHTWGDAAGKTRWIAAVINCD